MNRIYKYLLIPLIFLAGCVGIQNNPNDIPEQVVQWSKDNVWKVHAGGGAGSGFALDKDTVITACHVVEGRDGVLDVFLTNDMDTRVIWMTVHSCDTDLDVAILKRHFGDKLYPAQTTLHQGLPQGRAVYGAGFPMGMQLLITQGHMQQIVQDAANTRKFITAPTVPGDSGSPVLAVVNGEVVVVGIRVSIRVMQWAWRNVQLVPYLTSISPTSNIIKVLRDFEQG
jgi:serine protease Do